MEEITKFDYERLYNEYKRVEKILNKSITTMKEKLSKKNKTQ